MMVEQFSVVLFMFFALSLTCGNGDAAADKWDYESANYGVDAWPRLFRVCNGSRQSPIDIVNAKHDSSLGDVQLTNYDNIPASINFTAENNGHTYSVSFTGYTDRANHPKIHGGGLPTEFTLAGFHFHWGKNNRQGSEHVVNGMSYPAELHLVHLNKNYANVSEGKKHGDGLAVLGVFIKEGKHNKNFQFLNLTEYNVTYPGMKSKFKLSFLTSLLPSNKTFYRYNGSLTTPGCQEAVIWTVFSHYIELSAEQLGALRDMKYNNTMNRIVPLVDNFRPPQNLNGRMVLVHYQQPPTMTTSSTDQGSTTKAATNNTDQGSTTKAATNNTGQGSTTKAATISTTDGAYKVSENYFIFFTSFCLILLSFLEI